MTYRQPVHHTDLNLPGKILITGGNGLIGRILTSRLTEKGYQVAVLARNSVNNTGIPVFQWNPEKRSIDQEALRGVGCIIHLAGAGIGDKRWTSGRKREIVGSREFRRMDQPFQWRLLLLSTSDPQPEAIVA